jgi:hypothetical protein
MKKIALVFIPLLTASALLMAAPQSPRAISTLELAGVCGDQSSPSPQIYCDIYGQGVYDGYLVTRHTRVAPDFICVVQPAPARRDVMNQFMDWVKQNPAYNNSPAADSLLRFLAIRFPCQSSGASPENAINKIVR